MTKSLLLAAAVCPAALLAQAAPSQYAFQQQSWIRPASGVLNLDGWQKIEGQTGPVLNRPLSADEVRTAVQTLSDGSHVKRSETNRFYRDAQGRMLTQTETGAILYDPVAGFTYDLTTRTQTYTKGPIKPNSTVTIAAAAHYSSVSSHSSDGDPAKSGKKRATEPEPEELMPQMINGTLAKGSRVTITIPANTFGNDSDLKVINDRWVSDDLKLLVKSSNSDPRFGLTTYELKNIAQAPPDPALFQIPAGYTEKK